MRFAVGFAVRLPDRERRSGDSLEVRPRVFDHLPGSSDTFDVGVSLSENGVVQRVPSPVVMELSYGVSFGTEEEHRKVQNALRMYPIVEQDETIAQRAGVLLANADQTAGGESDIDKVDPMIAAVADIYDEPVLTANSGDFERLGVAVESY